MDSLFSTNTLHNVKVDSLKFGSALLVAQLLSMKPLTDNQWIKSSILTLVGFAVYQIIVRRFVEPTSFSNMTVRLLMDDILKWGTAFILIRLGTGQSLNDETWIRECSYFLLGLATFDIATIHAVDMVGGSLLMKVALADVIKYGTAFTVSQWLKGGEFDREWMVSSGGFILGLLGYDLILAGRI
jgi:hypothetical protein